MQRDEPAIDRWKRTAVAPDIKNAARRGAHLVFVDESGFLLIPNVRRTWAPRGQHPLAAPQVSPRSTLGLSGVAVSPRRRQVALYLSAAPANLTGLASTFLRHLLRHLRGPVVCSGIGGIHRRATSRPSSPASPRCTSTFPAYAPELNPDEFVWTKAKQELSNSDHPEILALMTHLLRSLRRLQGSQRLLWSCIEASNLPWP